METSCTCGSMCKPNRALINAAAGSKVVAIRNSRATTPLLVPSVWWWDEEIMLEPPHLFDPTQS